MDVLEVNYRWDGPDGFVRNEKVDADRLTPGLWICTATATDGDLESASMTDSIIVDENNESDESGARMILATMTLAIENHFEPIAI